MQRFLLLIAFFVSFTVQAQTTWMVDSLNDSGIGSLRAAVDSSSHGDTIRFSPSLIANGSDSIVLTSGHILVGGKRVIIKGLYNPTDTLYISGNDSFRIFLFSGGKVTLDSLVLVNGKADLNNFNGEGGAVLRKGCWDTLFVRNSIFRGSAAGRGGAIANAPATSTQSHTSVLSIDDCIFSGNTANFGGGAIYSWHCNALTTMSINNSTISGNSADGGGAIFSSGQYLSVSNIKVYNSIISGNTAVGGGGIYSYSNRFSSVEVRNSNVFNNSSTFNVGGGIYSYCYGDSALVTLINSTVSNNYSANSGGGVYCNGQDPVVKVRNSTVTGNSTAMNGGGVLCPEVDIWYSTISGNTAAGSGGGVDCTNAAVTSSTIVGNASNTSGGGLFCNGYTLLPSLIIKNSTVYGNSAVINGAGIYSDNRLICSSSIVAENGADSSGIYSLYPAGIISSGYNIFSDSVQGTIATDSSNVDSTQLNLQPLTNNGGFTHTMLPGPGSTAINNGNPLDFSDAQNAPIAGVRNVGAAEDCFKGYSSITVIECDSFVAPSSKKFFQTGVFSDTLSTTCGADSIITINLTINYSPTVTHQIVACDNYTWINGITYYFSNNTARYIVPNPGGCDSIYLLDLIIENAYVESYVVCDSLTWRDGITYSQSVNGVTDTVFVSGGCDSIFYLDLTVNHTDFVTDYIIACDSLIWQNGVTYFNDTTGVMDTLVNQYGCDSIVTLDLTISNHGTGIDTVSGCGIYQWINGQYYFMDNNVDSFIVTSQYGCDTTWFLNLTMHQGTWGVDTQVVCDSLVWIDGVTYYANNNTAVHTLVGGNSNGCDSVVYLNLTVNGSQSFQVITACDSLTWIDGNTYHSSTDTAKYSVINSLGCDSVISLDLTILTSSSLTDTLIACDSLTWVDGVTYYSDTSYAYVIQNSMGCDSLVSLVLEINESKSSVDSVVAVNQFTWVDGNTYFSSNNTATHLMQTIDGCDSLISLNLHIEFVEIGVHAEWPNLVALATNATFQWVECPDYGIIPGATDSVFTPTQNGSYAVIVTQNGYTDTSDCIVVNNVGIGEVSLSNNINIYPNPVHDQVNFEITDWPTNGVNVVVRDVSGKVVHQQEIEPISNKEIVTINTSKWAKGTYFVEVGAGENRVVEQIVVQ